METANTTDSQYFKHVFSVSNRDIFPPLADQASIGRAYLRTFEERWKMVVCFSCNAVVPLGVSELDLFTPFTRPVNWHLVRKKGGGYRTICDLPHDLKAAHYIISDLLEAQMPEQPFIYNLKGKGRDTLARMIRSKLNDGFEEIRTYDVRDCFSNVNTEALFGLPIPERVISHGLIIENLQLQRIEKYPVHSPEAPIGDSTYIDNIVCTPNDPKGIMQGSPASNQILAFLLQSTPQTPVSVGFIGIYGDDIISLLRDNEMSGRVDKSLTEFIRDPLIGSFDLLTKFQGKGTYFEFCGYAHSKRL